MPPPRHSAGGAARGPAGGSRGLGRRHQEAAAISPSAAGPSGLSERAPKRRRVLGSSERGSSEEDDFALAARLQREEDERAAREAARRLEEQDHQRLRVCFHVCLTPINLLRLPGGSGVRGWRLLCCVSEAARCVAAGHCHYVVY